MLDSAEQTLSFVLHENPVLFLLLSNENGCGLAPKQWGDLLVIGVKVSEGACFGSLASVGTAKVTCAFVVLITLTKSTCATLRAWQPQLYLHKVLFYSLIH